MLPIIIAFAKIILCLLPIIVIVLAAKRPRNKNGTFKKGVKWIVVGAVVAGIVGAISAGIEGSHEYGTDEEMLSDQKQNIHEFRSIELRSNQASSNATKTINLLDGANKKINLSIQNEIAEENRSLKMVQSLQASLHNERRTIRLASAISQDQKASITKQQSLLRNQQNTLYSQSQILKMQSAQIHEGEKTVQEVNRATNPIKNVSIGYWIELPLRSQEMTAYRNDLHTAVSSFLAQGSQLNQSSPFYSYYNEIVEENDDTHKTILAKWLEIRRGSALYTLEASENGSVFSYPISLYFIPSRMKKKESSGSFNFLDADIEFTTYPVQRPPRLYYDLNNDKLYLHYEQAFLPLGSILTLRPGGTTLPDLKGDLVKVMYSISSSDFTNNSSTGPSFALKDRYKVVWLDMSISDQPFAFGPDIGGWQYADKGFQESSFTFSDLFVKSLASETHLPFKQLE